MHQLPLELRKLAKASRDFAECKMTYSDPNELIADINKALDMVSALQDKNEALAKRFNEVRNSRDQLINELQSAFRKFDFTFRSL